MQDGPRRSSGKAAVGRKKGRKTARLDAEVRSKLGSHLRAMYDDVVRQGVPDRFTDLIRQIDTSGKREE